LAFIAFGTIYPVSSH